MQDYVDLTRNHFASPLAALAGLLGALVPCCLDLSLAHQYGECLCLPLLPGSTFAIRVGIRERYKIQVSVQINISQWGQRCLLAVLEHTDRQNFLLDRI